MFSIIIATHDSERALVSTLAALVPGATAGIVREVIVADGGSRDETRVVADIAGCEFISSKGPLGARLSGAAATARSEWLMFLAPGMVPGPAWIEETVAFFQEAEPGAAVFALENEKIGAWLRRVAGVLPRPEQGLMLRKSFYDELGGHRVGVRDPSADLLRRIGGRRLTILRTTAASDI